MNPLGIHHIPVHTGQHHYAHIRRVQPGILKTVAGEMPDVQLLSDAYQAAPNAIQYWRNHALSEQHADLWRDPVGTAKRHVAELVRDVRRRLDEAKQRGLPMPDFEQVHILGINEPVIEQFARLEDGRNLVEWTAMMNHRAPLLDDYMATFGTEALEFGICAGLSNFSTGTPPNRKPGAYPTFTWFPKTTRVLEANRGRLALAVHEYWTAATGPQARWDWHTHRFKHYEVDCDIDVLECGVEEHIDGKPHHGWQGLISADTYAAQMETYIRRCMTDSRFRGATPFTLDGHGQWRTFYIEDAMPEFEALADQLREPQQTHTVHIPVVIGPPSQPDPEPTGLPPVTQPPADDWADFQRCYAFTKRWEGGWANHPADKGGPTMRGITLATFTKWRHAQGMGTPTADDLRNIRDDEVEAIYYQWFWKPSGASGLPYPANLVRFDTAVLFGVDVARWYAQEAGPSEYALLGLRLLGHAGSVEDDPSQADFWDGWRNRVMELREIVRQARGWS